MMRVVGTNQGLLLLRVLDLNISFEWNHGALGIVVLMGLKSLKKSLIVFYI